MSSHEATQENLTVQNQQPRESIFNRVFSRRKVVIGGATVAAGAVAASIVGCGDGNENSPASVAIGSPEGESIKEFTAGEAILPIDILPGGVEELAIENAYPRRMVVRKGSKLTTTGIFQGKDDKNLVAVSITDPQRTTETGEHQSFACILPSQVASDQQREGICSFAQLVGANGGSYDESNGKSVLGLKEGGKGFIPMIAADSAPGEQHKAGEFFVDRDPLKKDHPLLEHPVVPTPDKSILPDGGTITQLEDGRVVTKDASGKLIARAITQRGLDWRWTKKEHLINDYCPSELADALDFTIGSHGFWNLISDPNWIENFLSIANKMRIDDPFWNKNQFVQNIDWGKIMGDWNNAQKQFEAGTIPFEAEIFNQQWVKRTEDMLDFAEKNNLPVLASKLYWFGDFRDELYSDKYSIDDKKKMVEFMVKAKVLKYKGRVHEWTTTPEMATAYEPWMPQRQRDLMDALGGVEMIHNIHEWAKEMDPNVTTVIVEDRLLDDTNFSVSTSVSKRFFSMLDQLRKMGTKIDKIGPENNFWIGDPTHKAKMVSVLKLLQSMGYGISMAQTTISTSDTPIDKNRPKTVGSIKDKEQAQSDINTEALEAYFETGSEFGYHSTSDNIDWIALSGNIPDANSTIVTKAYTPKKAFLSMVSLLKQKLS